MHSDVLRREDLSEWVTDQEQELKCLEFQKHKGLSRLLGASSWSWGNGVSLWCIRPLTAGEVCQDFQRNCEVCLWFQNVHRTFYSLHTVGQVLC